VLNFPQNRTFYLACSHTNLPLARVRKPHFTNCRLIVSLCRRFPFSAPLGFCPPEGADRAVYRDARLGKFDVLLVWAPDRLSREDVCISALHAFLVFVLRLPLFLVARVLRAGRRREKPNPQPTETRRLNLTPDVEGNVGFAFLGGHLLYPLLDSTADVSGMISTV